MAPNPCIAKAKTKEALAVSWFVTNRTSTQWVIQTRFMHRLPYQLATTNDQLTSRGGLLAVAQLMQSLLLGQRIDQHFPKPKSNRGYAPSVYLQSFILMHHEGHFHLDDVRHLTQDSALRNVLGLEVIPQASSLGAWLRKMGHANDAVAALAAVNKAVLQAALHRRKKVENVEFIQQCQRALSHGCTVGALRIDAAGYQTRIIQYCDEQKIDYAIRATMSPRIKKHISELNEGDWQPLVKRHGSNSGHRHTYRMPHCIGDYDKAFDLVIQRQPIRQSTLDLGDGSDSETYSVQGYISRAIATNRFSLTDSQVIHWYNQRAENSENRIKELKLDFGGDPLPCSAFKANALYFRIAALSYNLFALMRQLLPEQLASHRATTIRWRLYGMAAKVVRTGCQLWVKLQDANRHLLDQVLAALWRFEPSPL